MNNKLKTSIITCCFNAEATIEKTLQSVAMQTYKNYEHIIIDGGSSDNTLKIIEKYSHISKVISEKDSGLYDAFNKGLQYATGDVLGYLNADDIYFDNDSLKQIIEGFDDFVDAVFGDLVYVNDKGNVVRFWKSKPYKPNQFLKGWVPAHPTFYCRRWCYEKYGIYDDNFWISSDFDLMFRFIEINKIKTKYLNDILIKMLIGGKSNGSLKTYIESHLQLILIFRKYQVPISITKFTFSKINRLNQFLKKR